MAPKRKEGGAKDEPGARKRAPPAKHFTAPSTGEDGYTARPQLDDMGAIIYKCSGAPPNERIAAFDLDGTITETKSGSQFPIHADDWKFWGNGDVAAVLKAAHDSGHRVVIFTNQGGIKGALEGKNAQNVKARCEGTIAAAGIPIDVFMAPQDDEMRKPMTGMWKFMIAEANGGVAPNLAESYFVGDAAGRGADAAAHRPKADHSACDKEFAEAVGIEFKLPEDVFTRVPEPEVEEIEVTTGSNQELRTCFDKMASLLGTGFKANAFRKVSKALMDVGKDVTSGKEAEKLPGIGKSSKLLIDEFLASGKMQALEDLQAAKDAPPVEAKPKDPKALAFL